MQRTLLPVLLLAAGAILSGPALAQSGATEYSLSLGAAFVPDYLGSDDREVTPTWAARIGNLYHPQTYLRLSGRRFESNLLPDDNFRLGLTAEYQRDYGDVEDQQVKTLSRPKSALQTGLLFGYEVTDGPRRRYAVEIAATFDALHGHGGQITPRLRFETPVADRLTLGGSTSVTWATSGAMSNRFGITAEDALRSGLRPYSAGAGVRDLAFGLSLTYAVTDTWLVTAIGSYQRLLGDAADSPIVADRGSRNNAAAGLLIGYRF